ncbi:hypothetical protein [Curtobacterium citreum]|uniref:Uncharacterized protein n=1 Tax=Curtobacterium citreum TaxID=2036 RepID=A0ABU8Y5Z2_9MICO
MNDHISPRLAAMRDALVADVDATAHPARPRRRRPTRGTVAAVVTAFAVGAGLTGGITAAALPGAAADAAREDLLATTTRYGTVEVNHASMLGSPAFTVTHGDASFSLGARPEGADRVTLTWECLDPGTFTVEVGGTTVADAVACMPGSMPRWSLSPLTGSGAAAVSVSGGGGARYAVWASWARSARIAQPSPQQQAAIADGTITLAEYTAAFDRLAACMAQAGHPIGDVAPSWYADGLWSSTGPGAGPWYIWSTPTEAVDVLDTQCAPREFEQVDTIWQGEHPIPEDPPAAG